MSAEWARIRCDTRMSAELSCLNVDGCAFKNVVKLWVLAQTINLKPEGVPNICREKAGSPDRDHVTMRRFRALFDFRLFIRLRIGAALARGG
jgi:hypothetical protein